MRDDFTEHIIKQIALRVNYRCSSPVCQATTTGPQISTTKSLNVGVAAHITAASPDGPRYNPELTSEQRKHADNGIWLCQTCGKLVDNDPAKFTEDLLKEWKQNAELEAFENIGKSQSLSYKQEIIQEIQQGTSAVISEVQRQVANPQQFADLVAARLQEMFVPSVQSNATHPIEFKLQEQIDSALRWIEKGKPEAALVAIEEVRSDPSFINISSTLKARAATINAKCAGAVGDTAAAIAELEEAARLAPDNVKCLSNAAAAAIMKEEYDRAISFANKVLSIQPQDENSAMVLVQSWYHLGEAARIEEFLKNRDWFFESPNCCAALAQVRSRQGRYDEAIRLARQALRIDKKHVEALEALYDASFVTIRNKVWNGELWRFNGEIRRQMKRAEAAINRAVAILENSPNRVKLHQVLSNRAAVRSAQEKIEEAIADCDRILLGNPTPSNRELAALNKGLILVHARRAEEAIPLLESLKEETRRAEGAFALAFSYQKVGRLDEAATLLESIWHPENAEREEYNYSQWLIAETLIDIHRRRGKPEDSEVVIKRLQEARPDHPETVAILAQYKFEAGDVDDALHLLQQKAAFCKTNGDDAAYMGLMLRLGDICYRVGRFKEAAQAWQECGFENLISFYRICYLDALHRIGQLGSALQVARRIREEDGFSPQAAEIEAAICAYKGDWGEARALCEQLSRCEPNISLHKVNVAYVALQQEDPEGARIALQSIPYESVKDNALLLRRMAEMQAHFGMGEAIQFAFRARQIDFGNPESHSLYVNIFLNVTSFHSRDENGEKSNTRAADVLGLNGPQLGTVPCTIRLRPVGVDDERQNRSFTILKEGPFDRTHDVYSPQDEFAQQLLGLTHGETITLRQSPVDKGREYRVVEVLSPYVHAFQESGIDSAKWFGQDAGVWSIDIRDGFDEFWAQMDTVKRGFNEVMRHYAEWRFPLCTASLLQGRSLIDLWFLVVERFQWGIHAERGSTQLFEQAIAQLQSKGEKPVLVLDTTSILALAHLEIVTAVAPHFRFLVPQSLYREIKNQASEPLPPHVPNNLPEKLLSFIENQAEVLPARAVIQFPPEQIRVWKQTFGQSELDTMLLAIEHDALLYADDALLREVAKVHPGVEGINTQCLLESLHRQDRLTREEHYEFLEKLAQSNYRHLLLSTDFFLWLLNKHQNITNRAVRSAFHFLEGPMCGEDGAILIIATIISKLWTSPQKNKDRFNVLDLCLLSLVTGRTIGSVLVRLKQTLLNERFGLISEKSLLIEILTHINQWEMSLNPTADGR